MKLVLTIALALVLGSIGVAAISFWLAAVPPGFPNSFFSELGKASVSLAIVGVIGVALSQVYDSLRAKAQVRQLQREQRKELLQTLHDVRFKVEQARRVYRLGLQQDADQDYVEACRKILEARLDLANVWNNVRTAANLFSCGRADRILFELAKMKVYLDNIIQEFEGRKIAGEAHPHFNDLAMAEKDGTYLLFFLRDTYRPAVGLFREEIGGKADYLIEDPTIEKIESKAQRAFDKWSRTRDRPSDISLSKKRQSSSTQC